MEKELIQRAQKGNTIAAEQLYARYHNRIFSYLWRMTQNRLLAEDAAQETFFKGIKGLKNYREKGTFKSWLFKIAYNEGLRILKKERKYFWQKPVNENDNENIEVPWQSDGSPMNPTPLSDDVMIEKEQQRAMEAALARLPVKERQVVVLRIHEGLSFQEISTIMNCSINTSLGRMHNAVRRMKKMINKGAGQP